VIGSGRLPEWGRLEFALLANPGWLIDQLFLAR
jgi:hypothetical protein